MAEILGIDIGGTGIKGAIVDTSSGFLLTERYKILTPAENNPQIILDVIKSLVDKTRYDGDQIGCGFPAIMKNGVCHSASNVDDSFIGFNLKEFFDKNSDHEFHIINDADAAGIAELHFGAGKGMSGPILILTVGTGIGSAMFMDGKLFPNTEFGHIKFKGDIAEKYTSNNARKRFELSWDEWGKRLNEYLNHIEFLINPELIILGGGVSKKFHFYEEHISLQRCKVMPAELKNEAGAIGAALSCVINN